MITLSASCLWSKWGFYDGDMLDDILWDHDFGENVSHHDVLALCVERYLAPALPEPVELQRICTCHNPIRASDVGEREAPEWARSIHVDVSVEQVLECAREVMAQPACKEQT